jgi:hypothetical protein
LALRITMNELWMWAADNPATKGGKVPSDTIRSTFNAKAVAQARIGANASPAATSRKDRSKSAAPANALSFCFGGTDDCGDELNPCGRAVTVVHFGHVTVNSSRDLSPTRTKSGLRK